MPIKYIPFFPEPIEGQAILDNFKRTLKYKGCNDITENLKRGMPYYEVKDVEKCGKKSNSNMLIKGECLTACAYLKEKGIKVDLVYIDPPFASGADYAKKVFIRKNPKIAEKLKKVEQELETNADFKEFEEKMYGDVWNKEKYLNWMYENLLAIKSIMNDNASIYVHLDWHIGPYVKILLDEIFGEHNFKNEIIWHYQTYQGQVNNYFPRKHDNIYYYSMNSNHYFRMLKDDNPENTIDYTRWKQYLNENNEIKGCNYPKSDSRFDGYLKRFIEENGREPNDDDVIFKIEGNTVDSVWNIKAVDPKNKAEKVDYATQKPDELLSRIIQASSDEGMIVADFFMGSGTTVKAANNLNRKFIGCDIGINSIQTTRDRLVSDKASFTIKEVKDGVELFRNPQQTMDKLSTLIPGIKKDNSLSNFWFGSISDSKSGLIPVYVPNLLDSSQKLLDVVTVNRIIHEAIPELPNNINKVYVYYIDISDFDEINKFINDDESTNIEIVLKDLKELLDDVVINDSIEYSISESSDLINQYLITINRFTSDRVLMKINEFNQKNIANSGKKKFVPIDISNEGLETIEYISLDCTNSDGNIWNSDSEIKINKFGYVIKDGVETDEFWDGTISSENKPLRLKVRNICGDETIVNL